MLRIESERTRHAAAAGIEQRPADTQLVEQRGLALHSKHRLLMTVPVHDYIGVELWPLKVRARHKVREEKRLLREPFSHGVVRQLLQQFVLEYGKTAWFKPDHRYASADVFA